MKIACAPRWRTGERGVHVNISGAGVTADADDPDLASDLIEWLATEGQEAFVYGNHEYPVNDGFGYFDYWDNVPHYYSFDAAGWHIVSLNSTREFGQYDAGTAQYQWLAQDLASHPTACSIVYFHNPPFRLVSDGSDPFNSRFDDLWQLLADNGVDIILNGGPIPLGRESTIVDVTQSPPRVLRAGAVPPEQIEEAFLGPVGGERLELVAEAGRGRVGGSRSRSPAARWSV